MANTTNNNEPETKNVSDQKDEVKQEDTKAQSGPEMVQISKEELEKLKGLIPAVEQLQRDNQTLLAVADRAKLQEFQERQKAPGNKVVKLSTYMGDDGKRKVIVAWKKLKDEVYKGTNGNTVEDQSMEIAFDDNTTKELPLKTFYRDTADKIKAEVLEDKGDAFKVRTPEGKEYLINKEFVN
jgi:hypothetical protein